MEAAGYFVLLRVLATDADRGFPGFRAGFVQFVYPLAAGGLEEVTAWDDEGLFRLSEFDLDKEKVARYAEDMAGLWEVTYYHRELRPGVKEALEELKNKGYRLGVISNTASLYSVFDVLEAYGIRDYFEDVTLSSVTGYRKPHPGIFQIALREMKAKAEECAYVGDTLSRDVIGAKRMHFGAAIQIRSFLSSQKDEGVDSVWQPDHVVEKIADIVPYLEKLNGRA